MSAKVYSYIRFSDEKQAAGASLDRQTDYAAQVAARKGLVLDDELRMFDAGLSAFHADHKKRGKFGLFMAAIQAGKVTRGSVLVVEDFDRLSRQAPMDALDQLREIVDAGVTLITANGMEFSTASLRRDPSGLFLVLSKMITANQESEVKKSRVTDAMRRRCQAIESGHEKFVGTGGGPGWMRQVKGEQRWEFIPERAAAVREAIDLFLSGAGAGFIANHLAMTDQRVSSAAPHSGQIIRMFTRVALKGEKRVIVNEPSKDGIDGAALEYVFPNYYPAVISVEKFDEVQVLLASRARKGVVGTLPSLLTGTGITTCGYCGASMKAQMMTSKTREDGTLADCHRRLQCSSVNVGGGCSVKGSCSSGPIERHLMQWLSEIGNLRSLYDADSAASGDLATARAALMKKEKGIRRLKEALEDDDARMVKEIKVDLRAALDERDDLAARVVALELAAEDAARADRPDIAARWASLRVGVDALDYEARMQARQLVVETFANITVFHSGTRPAKKRGNIVLRLRAKGGVEKELVINES